MTPLTEPFPPSAHDAELARESSAKLANLASTRSDSFEFQVTLSSHKREKVVLPKGAMKLLVQLLIEMSKGNAVTLLPVQAQLTTQQAAEILGVSRPFLIKEIKEKKIPCHTVGTHRRVFFRDVMAYKRRHMEMHEKAMNQLAEQAQELHLGY